MFWIEAMDNFGDEKRHDYFSREEAEQGAVRLLRAGRIRVRLFDPQGHMVMSLTQAQLKLFEGDPKWN